ncbi:MAG TPA: NAD(P)/FAD-dependent oxidoreductase, partial [Flavipsychrobacter sp.]|nr:NAD(P)/FAD-dependent oxidoreductase [Flavipsychrobacter sp.]
MAKKRVVILGAGFAGLQLARRIRDVDYEITIVDQYNFHQFQPLFYQVATARLEPSSISFPLRKVFQREKNVHVRISRVEMIDMQANTVQTADREIPYDYLVIATGCTSNFFGNKNIEKYAYPMKSTTEAITLRNRILLNFEDALTASHEELSGIMNIVIVGGGPTGVELAGALAEMKTRILPRDYPDMDFSNLGIYLLEGQDMTLSAMSETAQKASKQYLENLGVQVWTGTIVADYDGNTVHTKDGRIIRARTLIWAAGVMGNIPMGIPKDLVVKGNRIKVDQFNRLDGIDNVFAIGDVAYMENKDWPKGHPQLANVATNQAKNLAKNFLSLIRGRDLRPFIYKNPGTMATIGKRKAVVDLPA